MMLGDSECEWDIAYFLENGKYPSAVRRCKRGEVSISDALEREWEKPDMHFIIWQGCRLGSQFDWLS